jgi:hypothetical protein
MFGKNTKVLSTSLFKIIRKLARRGGSQIINKAQKQNSAKAIDYLEKFGKDLFASVSQQEDPTQRAFKA